MRKLLICMLAIMLYACSPTKEAFADNDAFEATELFMQTTDCPQCVIDSICLADSLSLAIKDYSQWNERVMLTSDSIMQSVHWMYFRDSKVSIMVFEVKPLEKYVVKMVK